jgi:transaldolase
MKRSFYVLHFLFILKTHQVTTSKQFISVDRYNYPPISAYNFIKHFTTNPSLDKQEMDDKESSSSYQPDFVSK